MPVLTNCPSCGRQVRVPDELLGRQVRCPECGATFTATEAGREVAAVPPPGGYEEEPPEYGGRPIYVAEPPGRERAASAVRGPAIALLITGILGLLFDLFGVLQALGEPPPPDPDLPAWWNDIVRGAHGPVAVVTNLLFAGLSALVIAAAIQMLRLSTWGFALAGSIVAMINISNCCCLLGLPFGIWSLIVLSKPEVKAAFH